MSIRRLARNIILENDYPLITHVTVIGKLIPNNSQDYMKLVRLAWSFRKAVEQMAREIVNGASMKDATKKLYNALPNYVYLESAYKHAKLIVEGSRFNNGNPRHIHVRKFFIVSRGNKYDYGNRNIRLVPSEKYFEVQVKYPWDGSWIKARTFFGRRYIPLLNELMELCRRRLEGYGARIVFKDGRMELHLSIPLYLYLKYFSYPKCKGYELVAGLDLNSDRINMVVIDGDKRIVAMRAAWFPEVTLPGFPRNKARDIRLKKLKELLVFARRIGVDYVVFENLFAVKKSSRVSSPSGNRKITRFAKRQLLQHGLLMAMKQGLTPILVDPRGTTHSHEHEEVMNRRGLDRHMASAYIIACKGLKIIKTHEKYHKT